jgi:CRISPR-associated endonuclease Csn1
LKNLTVAEIDYNMNIKGKKIPVECPNYENDFDYKGVTYSAIKPRLKFMEDKVDHLSKLLDEWRLKTKFASTKDIKDVCIQRRHLIKFELDYWRRKLDTFICKEYKAGWRNSQLKDTQIVSKYALPYLKTIFKKVEVQKGNITSDFRKIYKIQPRLEKKERDKHCHHAIDAAVLTLIPPAAIRDKILFHYNEDKDNNQNSIRHEEVKDWSNFNANYILSIQDEVLINYLPKHNTLVPAIKKVRKRGKQQFVKYKDNRGKWHYKLGEDGDKIQLVAKGDTIRGQLHKESFFGAIKLNEEICLVERYPIASFTSMNDCKHIVDKTIKEVVQKVLEQRIESGKTFDQAKLEQVSFPSGNPIIKKVRCKVAAGRGYLTTAKAIPVRKHTFLSDKDYKQHIYAQNEENTLCLYYEQVVENKVRRAFRIIGLYELAQLKLNSFDEIKSENYYKSITIGKDKSASDIPLNSILKVGMKLLFYNEDIGELYDLSKIDLFKRIFRIYKFNETGSPLIYLQNHLEARPNDKLGNGETIFDPTKYQARLCLVANSFNCAIEGRDFEIRLDGEIVFL